MGWLSHSISSKKRSDVINVFRGAFYGDIVAYHFSDERDCDGAAVVYLALRTLEGDITGIVARYYFSHGDIIEKTEPESWGPYFCRCPKKILDILSPTDDEWAQEWRAKCRENCKAK